MIDSHCHLTYPQLANQLADVLVRAASAGVSQMITIGTGVADAQRAIALCRRIPEVLRCAVGIHPHYAKDVAPADLEALRELAAAPEVLALGEMGLDYHYDFSPRDRQREVFLAQLAMAQEMGRPIVIHCREAIDDCLEILKDHPGLRALFHCFTGSEAEARRILDRGYLLGFTGVVTFKNSDELRRVVQLVPADRLLLETDSPYLAPEPHRRQRVNEPSLIIHTARAVAHLRGVTFDEIDATTTANVQAFFGWPGGE